MENKRIILVVNLIANFILVGLSDTPSFFFYIFISFFIPCVSFFVALDFKRYLNTVYQHSIFWVYCLSLANLGEYRETFDEQDLVFPFVKLNILIVGYYLIFGIYRIIARQKEDKSISTIDSPVRKIDKILSISIWVLVILVMSIYPSKIRMKNSNSSYSIEQDDDWDNAIPIPYEEWKKQQNK